VSASTVDTFQLSSQLQHWYKDLSPEDQLLVDGLISDEEMRLSSADEER